MKIIADEQIPYVEQAFSGFGEIVTCDSQSILPGNIDDADMLLVRSVTRVNKPLLENSAVQFVATATSGTDHLDLEYLNERNIGFASAHGSNARSVVEYILSVLHVLASQNEFTLQDKVVGIIGCGRIGSALLEALGCLGVECIVNDPPLRDDTEDDRYRPLDELFVADFITLHVPYQTSAPYPTRDLVTGDFLANMKKGCFLINASRGGVVNEGDLQKSYDTGLIPAVLDVWGNEPDIDLSLLSRIQIGTPHIAGYSIDSKIRATRMIYEAACEYFVKEKNWHPDSGLMSLGTQALHFDPALDDKDIISLAILSHYDVRSDAAALRRVAELEASKAGQYFYDLRKQYPVRREFQATTIHVPEERKHLESCLRQLGFSVLTEPV